MTPLTRIARRRWALFPAAVLVLFGLFVGLELHGSSISLLGGGVSDGLVAGEPRPNRSDEFQIRTPIAISAVRQDFPDRPWIGLTPTDQAATAHGGPVREWSSVLKPQDWGYLLLGPSHGLAWSWWFSLLASLLGTFALFGLLTSRAALAALLAIGASFTPYAAWWTSPAPPLFLGYAAAAGALLVLAWRCESTGRRVLASLGAGLAATALVLALYPPWQISLVLVVGAACVGHAFDARVPFRRFACTVGGAAATAGILVGAWLIEHRSAISAVLETDYPGQRVTHAGGADWAATLSAPLNFWLAGQPGGTLGETGDRVGQFANHSELASSWLPLALVVAVAVLLLGEPVVSRLRRAGMGDLEMPLPEEQPRLWTSRLVLAAIGLLLAWAFVPLPGWFGAVTLLDKVQPTRTPLALGFASFVLVVGLVDSRVARGRWRVILLAVSVLVSGLLAMAASSRIPWDQSQVNMALVFLSGAGIALALALILFHRWAVPAAAALAVFAVVSWSLVNPWVRGLSALEEDPLAHALGRLPAAENPRTIVFGNLDLVAKVRAAGLQSVSGVTLYPDREVMSALLPAQEELWNNYGNYLWEPAGPGAQMVLRPFRGTLRTLHVDPCFEELRRVVDPGWIVSAQELDHECLGLRDRVHGGAGDFWIYELEGRG